MTCGRMGLDYVLKIQTPFKGIWQRLYIKVVNKEIGPQAENMDTILALIVDTSGKACVIIYTEMESPFGPLATFYLNFEYET